MNWFLNLIVCNVIEREIKREKVKMKGGGYAKVVTHYHFFLLYINEFFYFQKTSISRIHFLYPQKPRTQCTYIFVLADTICLRNYVWILTEFLKNSDCKDQISCSRHRTTKFPNSESPIFCLQLLDQTVGQDTLQFIYWNHATFSNSF